MRSRLIVACIVVSISLVVGLLTSCSSRESHAAATSGSSPSVMVFPGVVTPTPRPTQPPGVVRPILPTVPPDQRPTPTPEYGNPPTPILGDVRIPRSMANTENLLILGSDQRKPGTPWRTDVIMVVAIDRQNERVGVVSIPRDLWVKIPGVGWNRINTADFYGSWLKRKNKNGKKGENPQGEEGVELLKEILRQNMGIPIHHYMRVDFNVFKGSVDALGGITVTVDCPLRDPIWDKPGQRWRLEPGEYFMTGEDALKYVRSRHNGGDLDRARRQQRVLLAMRDRALEINLWPRIPALYREFRDKIVTDLGPLEMLDLARLALRVREENIHGFVIGRPMVRDWITPGGAMVLVPDYEKIRSALDGLFDLPPLSQMSDRRGHCP
ncbi:MAG: LCP family protein [Chloroflexi bacterium]|nr:LCP family protein [Chloroflexota bacterium]